MADTTANELDERHFVRPGQRRRQRMRKTSNIYISTHLMSRGREKKIHIGGQMSIAKKTSTTLDKNIIVIISIIITIIIIIIIIVFK